jgi:hypothetical protein
MAYSALALEETFTPFDFNTLYEREVGISGQLTLEVASPEEMGYDHDEWRDSTDRERKEMVNEYFKECSDGSC